MSTLDLIGDDREEKHCDNKAYYKLGEDTNIVLQVRVLEAAGLRRSTNFALKNVTIHKPYCAVQLRNVFAKGSTKSVRSTGTAKQTLFPIWDDTLRFEIDKDDINGESIIRLHVKGSHFVHPTDLGLVDIRIRDIKESCEKNQEHCYQDWFLLDKRTPPKFSIAGKLFVVFRMFEKGKHWNRRQSLPPIYNIEESKSDKPQDVGIYIGTMNCGNAPPPSDEGEIYDWLKCDASKHKIVVVGLQECAWGGEANAESVWKDAIQGAINRDIVKSVERYELLAAHSLTEMRIFVFVQEESLRLNKVCNVAMFNEATGIGGVYGNKGGTQISFDYGGTSLCFTNSHLAAHQTKFDQRNSDFREICKSYGVGNIKQSVVEQFHYIFWLGDLNYRCDWKEKKEEELTDSPPERLFNAYINKIDQGSYEDLIKKDQLSQMLDSGEKAGAFFGFKEHEITFKPTFKVEKGSDEYQKKRTPAWCDRILWRCAPGYEVKCDQYNSAPNVDTSDHKPVFGEYRVTSWTRQPGKVDDNKDPAVPKGLEIVFGECKFDGTNGRPDAQLYMHFPRQELFESDFNSDHSQEPVWKEVGPIPLQRTNRRFLENALVLFQIRDNDRFLRSTSLGSGCLSLKDILEDLENFDEKTMVERGWVEFKQKLTKDGVYAGIITGTYRLDESKVDRVNSRMRWSLTGGRRR